MEAQLQSALRVLVATDKQLEEVTPVLLQNNIANDGGDDKGEVELIEDCLRLQRAFSVPSNPDVEQRLLFLSLYLCSAAMNRMPTTLLSDIEAQESLSKQGTGSAINEERRKLALQYRVGKKRLLREAAGRLVALTEPAFREELMHYEALTYDLEQMERVRNAEMKRQFDKQGEQEGNGESDDA